MTSRGDSRGNCRSDPFFVKSTAKETGHEHFKKSQSNRNVERVSNKHIRKSDRNDSKNLTTQNEKKPFDKKKYRLKKYSNKYKLEQWEDERKIAVLRNYYKEIKHEKSNFDVQKIYAENDEQSTGEHEDSLDTDLVCSKSNDGASSAIGEIKSGGDSEDIATKEKSKVFKRAHLEFQRIKQEKVAKKEEAVKRREQKMEALKLYKQKKAEKFKRLSKKTRKGQPIMKDRLEMLLEQIQKKIVT